VIQRARTRTKSPRNPENGRARGRKVREIRTTGAHADKKVPKIRRTGAHADEKSAKSGERARMRTKKSPKSGARARMQTKSPQSPENGHARGQKVREIRSTGAHADKKSPKSGERARPRHLQQIMIPPQPPRHLQPLGLLCQPLHQPLRQQNPRLCAASYTIPVALRRGPV
jgi:hypothetical protein